jgi:hypothetical protein
MNMAKRNLPPEGTADDRSDFYHARKIDSDALDLFNYQYGETSLKTALLDGMKDVKWLMTGSYGCLNVYVVSHSGK